MVRLIAQPRYCLDPGRHSADIEQMEKSVIFVPAKDSNGEWQIVCHLPDGKVECVTGFLDEVSTKNWLASEHRTHWLQHRKVQ